MNPRDLMRRLRGRKRTIPDMAQQIAGLISRVRVDVANTAGALWGLLGATDDEGNTEAVEAPVFGGVGFMARPASSSTAEAITATVGGASEHPVIIATRDAAAQEAAEGAMGALEPDESAMYTTISHLRIRKDTGVIEARTHAGVAVAIATLADVQAQRSWSATHTHPVATTGTASAQTGTAAASGTPPPEPIGTTKFLAE